MSLQDDYYDVAEKLKGTPEAAQFENIWFAYCFLECQNMVREGDMTKEQFDNWATTRIKELNENLRRTDKNRRDRNPR